MSRRLPSNAGVGVASILLLVVMLCMTIFASLSLLTAKNDADLTNKTIAYTQSYYAADAKAQRMLAQIAQSLQTGASLPAGVARDGDTLAFSVPVNDATALSVELTETADGYIIQSYGVKPIETEEPEEEPLNLWG